LTNLIPYSQSVGTPKFIVQNKRYQKYAQATVDGRTSNWVLLRYIQVATTFGLKRVKKRRWKHKTLI